MEDMMNTEFETPDTTTPTIETSNVPNTDFEKMYKNEKKRNKSLFIGGTAVGAFGAFFWLKKMQPGLKALREKKKEERAAKRAAKRAEKEALESAND